MQQNLIKSVIISFLLLCHSCRQTGPGNEPAAYFGVISIPLLEHIADMDDFGAFMPLGIACSDDVFYVQAGRGDLLSMIDLSRSESVPVVLHGNGPGELLTPTYLTASGHKATLADCNKSILAEVDMSAYPGIISFTELPQSCGPITSVISGDDFLILSGLFEQGRFMHYERNSGNISFSGEYRLGKGYAKWSERQKSQAYINTKLAIRPDFSRFAAINYNSGIIDICEIGEDGVVHLAGVDLHYPCISFARGDTVHSADNKNGFMDIAVSEHLICSIYSGKSYREKGPDFSICDVLMTFDWDGNPLTYYNLPQPLNLICYDNIRDTFYGVSPGETTRLFRLNL